MSARTERIQGSGPGRRGGCALGLGLRFWSGGNEYGGEAGVPMKRYKPERIIKLIGARLKFPRKSLPVTKRFIS